MKNIIVYDKFKLDIEREAVLRLMDCYPESPVYEEACEEYEELKPEMLERINPRGVICFGTVPEGHQVEGILEAGAPIIYSIVTIGSEASQMSSLLFEEGDYLKGMIADVMADSYVFAMEKNLREYVKEECKARGFGISNRYEAPNDIPMDYQLLSYEYTEAKAHLDMEITKGYMLDPLKSNCQVFVLTEETELFRMDHDCRRCENTMCKLRHIPDTMVAIYNQLGELQERIFCKYQESILEAYVRNGGYLPAPCGGTGKCGKCKIRLRTGELTITNEDKECFTNEELSQGYRLSCKAYPEQDCEIELTQSDEKQFSVLGATISDLEIQEKDLNYRISIDIGTTTLALALVEVVNGQVVDIYTDINHQRAYGTDVISRIQASNEGKGEELRELIRRDLMQGIEHLLRNNNVESSMVKGITIAANTTMIHLLLGFSCQSLGVVPFTPVDIRLMELAFQKVFSDDIGLGEVTVTILPGISTYVGGDIVSGLFVRKIYESEHYNLFVDLGTNGEIALGNKDKILVTSTAMGPACEGGNITWGMGSVPGAISNVDINKDGTVNIKTIGGQHPIGICGTGVLETVAELMKQDLVDETGLLEECYCEEGFPIAQTINGTKIVFTQKDIREIQLAKSAVRAGIETLIKRVEISYEQIERLYLAGGFGAEIDKEKAIAIGMLPVELRDKVEVVGNTALAGAIQYVEENRESMNKIVDISEEISLSVDKVFNELYIENMFFEN